MPGIVRDYAKLQALVYDIRPWRKVPESDAGSVGLAMPDATRSSPEWFCSNVGGMWAISVLYYSRGQSQKTVSINHNVLKRNLRRATLMLY